MSKKSVITGKAFVSEARSAVIETLRKHPDPEYHGTAFDPDLFTHALAKAKRHMRNKYGSVAYEIEYREYGVDNVIDFYFECLRDTTGGRSTFNRDVRRGR